MIKGNGLFMLGHGTVVEPTWLVFEGKAERRVDAAHQRVHGHRRLEMELLLGRAADISSEASTP